MRAAYGTRGLRSSLLALVVISIGCTGPSESADSAESDLTATNDATFGTNGVVETGFDPPTAYNDFYRRLDMRRVFVQADGKIVLFGLQGHYKDRVALARYLPNGSLDSSFGTGGRAQPAFPSDVMFHGAALQNDGSILLVGAAVPNQTAIGKVRADGSVDSTFGQGGVSRISLCDGATFNCQPEGIAIEALPSGKLLVLSDSDRRLARFKADGSLDTTFGVNGQAVHNDARDPLLTSLYDYRGDQHALRVQSDGRIVVLDTRTEAQTVRRWNADGTPDASFGVAGRVPVPLFKANPGRNVVEGAFYAMSPQPDGTILLAGSQEDSHNYPPSGASAPISARVIVVLRLRNDGTRDTTFGVDGYATTGLRELNGWHLQDYRPSSPTSYPTLRSVARAVVVDGSGGVIVVGDVDPPRVNPMGYLEPGNDDRDLLAVRYAANGTLDTTFGVGGVYRRNVRNDDLARDAVLRSNGADVRLLIGLNATVSIGRGFDGNGVNGNDPDSHFALVQLKLH
jgi:uncharacterized delta-60 repeat protein